MSRSFSVQLTRCMSVLLIACSPSLGLAADPVFKEADGLVAVEAEHYVEQSSTDKRAWHLTSSETTPDITPDGDPPHVAGASGKAYLEILPDTRRTHGDKLIRGTNFAPEAGEMAVLSYKVHFTTPGKYYVWVRAYSTGSEDNGLHVGIDGQWPDSGQRLQWCQGKNEWRWESKQRTEEQHCGEPYKIFLDVPTAGEHTISFSMREDGFEFDKWIMTTDRDFTRPEDAGPTSKLHSGSIPATPPAPKASQKPEQVAQIATDAGLFLTAKEFDVKNEAFYIDRGQWLAINPDQHKQATADTTFQFPTGTYDVTLHAIGENDGMSTYTVNIDDKPLGEFKSPLSKQTAEDAAKYRKTWKNIAITDGAIVTVKAATGSEDGEEFSRARWAGITFTPADATTRKEAKPYLAKQASKPKQQTVAAKASPTKPVSNLPLMLPRRANGDGSVNVSGETKQWHKVTLNLRGPYAHEQDNSPNPFTDYAMTVAFKHSDGTTYTVPGYFAADGNAGDTSAEAGTTWRAHFAPDRTGEWTYTVSFRQGPLAALDTNPTGVALAPFDGKSGKFSVSQSDKQGRDLRAVGRLQYVGKHYLQFASSKQYFLKAGADAPETLLGYADFDGTVAGKPSKVPLKTWAPHIKDWTSGDPTWQNGKGKGLIGAINYLSGKGCNAFSFLTYNAGGDGDNVWPFIQRNDKLHYDCSKLDQWGIVFDHGTAKGMYLHFKMQETENDDKVPTSLDGGDLGVQRKLYCRELIARFAHNLALNWNLGEENTQSTEQLKAMLAYIDAFDAYDHNRVLHTFPGQQDSQYEPLLGDKSALTGVSLQNSGIHDTHWQTVKWVEKSKAAGKPWVVAFDESGTAAHGQCPDLGYRGFDGHDSKGNMTYTQHEVRKQTLWGTLMGGGAGVEYYFGYAYAENDLVCEDWRSRDQSWDYCRIALNFFHDNEIPFWEMTPQDALVGNEKQKNTKFCLAKPGHSYVVYLCDGGTAELDLSNVKGDFSVQWFNPRSGGSLQNGSVKKVSGGSNVNLGQAPSDQDQDWTVVVQKQ